VCGCVVCVHVCVVCGCVWVFWVCVCMCVRGCVWFVGVSVGVSVWSMCGECVAVCVSVACGCVWCGCVCGYVLCVCECGHLCVVCVYVCVRVFVGVCVEHGSQKVPCPTDEKRIYICSTCEIITGGEYQIDAGNTIPNTSLSATHAIWPVLR
jgi:hypothetical protein